MSHQNSPTFVTTMRTPSSTSKPRPQWQILEHRDSIKSVALVALMLFSTFASIQYGTYDALAAGDRMVTASLTVLSTS